MSTVLSKSQLKTLRFLSKKKFSLSQKMFFPSRDALEQSTPEIIARYRATRLACDTILDMGCGVGMDSIALASHCKKVIAVDSNERVIECAQENARVYGCKNIEFIHADYSELDLKKLRVTAVFSDPSRRVNGARVKSLTETQPHTRELIRWISSQGISDFAIEVSRNIFQETLDLPCEREFISWDCGNPSHIEPNCLTLYFGKFKHCEKSIIHLPEKIALHSSVLNSSNPTFHSIHSYLYELNPGIEMGNFYADLLQSFSTPVHYVQPNFLTSDSLISSPFFKNTFQVLALVQTETQLVSKLRELHAGKLVLRGSFPPNEQLQKKQLLESQLTGTQKLHVFFQQPIIICKNMAFE